MNQLQLKKSRYNRYLQVLAGLFALLIAFSIALAIKQYSAIVIALPFAGILIIAGVRKITAFYYVLAFSLPFAINISIGSSTLFLPSEPLSAGLAGVAILFMLSKRFDKELLLHPISLAVFFFLIINFLTAFTTTMPVISVKNVLIKLIYALVFFFLFAAIIKHSLLYFKNMVLLYSIAVAVVVLFISWKFAQRGFETHVANLITGPFFSDHTIYGACLASILPLTTGLLLARKEIKGPRKALTIILAVIILTGILLSTSRAVWVSVIAGGFMCLLLLMRVKFWLLLSVFLVILISGSYFQDRLYMSMMKNKYDSEARGAHLDEQIKSVTNINTDVSNVERINRWKCAYRMFLKKPLTGFGPGTYQFKYLPYQKTSEMTVISVTTPRVFHRKGIGGTAHSEYLLALSESGFFGMLAIILMALLSIYYGMELTYKSKSREIRILAGSAVVGLTTYFLHGLFNNFLDTDKAAFLVFGSMALITALHVYYQNSEDPARNKGEIIGK